MMVILLAIIVTLLAGAALFTVVSLSEVGQQVGPLLEGIGVGILLLFSLLVLMRYVALLFFSMAKNLRRTLSTQNQGPAHFRVSVIVPAYNESKVIERSVCSIIQQSYPLLEIVVVDDGSTDDTFARAEQLTFDDGVRSLLALRKPNGGKASALNYGIEHCRGDLVMVVDADSRLETDAIARLVQYFEDPEVAAVAGAVYVNNRHNTLTRLQALEYIQGLNMVRNGQSFFELVTIIPGPIGVFRKSVLLAEGGYEQDTFAEDADLTLKLVANGYRIDFEPEAFAYTEAPDELLDLLKQRYRWTRGILQSLAKHRRNMWRPFSNGRGCFVVWYMYFESILWPVLDVAGTLFFVYLSFETGNLALIFYWWLLFLILDLSAALYCIMTTREQLSLLFYALLYRLYFISVINISKLFATIEECINLKMDWGKLDRKGGI